MTRRPLADLDRQARKSSLVVAAVLLGVAAWNLYVGRTHIGYPTAATGSILAFVGLAVPAGARAFHKAWMRIAHALGWLNSRILLGAMFYLVLTPVGWMVRLTGGDPLNRRRPRRDSYWIPRKNARPTPEQFERLF